MYIEPTPTFNEGDGSYTVRFINKNVNINSTSLGTINGYTDDNITLSGFTTPGLNGKRFWLLKDGTMVVGQTIV